MNVIENIKAHPALTAAVAVGAVVFIVVLRSGSGGGVTPAPLGDVGSGDALQAAMLQIQHDIGIANISAQASAAHDAASLEAAKLAADVQNNTANIQGNVALAQINASLQALTTHDTLAAQVEQGSQQAQVNISAISANAQTEQLKAISTALVTQSQIQAGVAAAAIEANKKQCGLWGKIFGC